MVFFAVSDCWTKRRKAQVGSGKYFQLSRILITRSLSHYAALLLGPFGVGTLASRAEGLRPPWVAFGHMTAPCGRRGAFGSYRWPSATCDPPISQTMIASDPVQISQIRYGKSTISQILIVSDPVQISQICYGKYPSASQP